LPSPIEGGSRDFPANSCTSIARGDDYSPQLVENIEGVLVDTPLAVVRGDWK